MEGLILQGVGEFFLYDLYYTRNGVVAFLQFFLSNLPYFFAVFAWIGQVLLRKYAMEVVMQFSL